MEECILERIGQLRELTHSFGWYKRGAETCNYMSRSCLSWVATGTSVFVSEDHGDLLLRLLVEGQKICGGRPFGPRGMGCCIQ